MPNVQAVWGLGEGIVSGTITPDHYSMDRETYEIINCAAADEWTGETLVWPHVLTICQSPAKAQKGLVASGP
jgi:hypothetical protein